MQSFSSIKNDVPLYLNTKDNTHCFQASLKMILKYFQSEKNYSNKKLEQITAKKKSLWTWPTASLIWLKKNNFEVIDMKSFDYALFIKKKDLYLIKEFGEEVGKSQIKHSDIKQEVRLARKLLQEINIKKTAPDIKDIKKLLLKNFLIIVSLNSNILSKKSGYSSHSVVITGFNSKKIFINDPGLPGIKNKEVSLSLFEKAWSYPNKKARNVIAIKASNI